MHRLSAKLGLFAAVWYELTLEGGLEPGTAFVVTLLLMFFASFVLRLLGLAMQAAGPGVVSVGFHTLIWFILFWWMAPPWLWRLPWIADFAALGLLGLIGARCRQDLSRVETRAALWRRKERSLVIVVLVIIGAATGMAALHVWGSLWPLVGYALLPAIPFRVGWQWAPPVPPERADAKMGERSAYEKAGWSAER